jgi:hypothetical protein
VTVVGFGSDAANKHLTTWFRRVFQVPDPSVMESQVVRLQRNDGAVVHVNGFEVFRSNMPAGAVGIGPGSVWLAVPNAPVHGAGRCRVIVTTTFPSRFYRLLRE